MTLGLGCLTACGKEDNGNSNSNTNTNNGNNSSTEGIENMGPVVLTSEKVKIVGRTHLMDDVLWLAFSGAGAEFVYEGKKLDITFVGDNSVNGGIDNQARVAVYVDGERTVDEMIDQPEMTVTAFENSESKKVNVQIVKLSETAMSTVGVKPITLADGEKITPADDKAHKIEFVGDSITCGYGVDDEVKEHHFSTSTEDVTKAYAYKTAEKLNADYSMVSISGYGIISGYSSNGNKVPSQALPQYYDKMGFSYNKFANTTSPQNVEWDFESFRPEVIIINLGTNDNSYVKGNSEKKQEYVDGYLAFLKTVREKNPDAEIFCVLGIMGAELYSAIEGMVSEYSAETGDQKIHPFKLPVQDWANGYAADWHPTEKNHEIAAQAMADEITRVMGW
ncbi:MAG: hypothetical protein E7509_07650 [Ruminococcus sp.]|nr:hypothetical protein [Ruminococcus sp.]